jgi:hapalindole biogenesis HpiC1 cyclase-like protein/PEP-CTERM motif-containing protein
MKIFKFLSSAMFCAAGLAVLGAKADAATIPVVNSHFDMFPTVATNFDGFMVGPGAPHPYLFFSCGAGCAFADDNIVGWTSSGTFQRGILSGQWQIGQVANVFNSPPIIAGTTSAEPIVVRDINATISQIVSTTALAGVTYTLDVDLGFAKLAPDDASVDLIVGGNKVLATPLASYNLTQKQMQDSGNWYDFQASYTATNADAGHGIEILLSSLTGNATPTGWFADVRLTDSLISVNPLATPEPAPWVMMLLGFGGMAGVAAVRRSLQRRRSAVGQLRLTRKETMLRAGRLTA